MMRANPYHSDEVLLIMMISKQVLDKKKGFQDVLSETMTLPKFDGNVITECFSLQVDCEFVTSIVTLLHRS